jgi:hypothetical protein
MDQKQLSMIVLMSLAVVFVGPVCVLFAMYTIPGFAILMMIVGPHWLLDLYPFVFAGYKTPDGESAYYLDWVVSIPLTVLQWVLVACVFSCLARALKPGLMVLSAIGLALLVVALTAAVLSYAGIELVVPRPHL